VTSYCADREWQNPDLGGWKRTTCEKIAEFIVANRVAL
jgi:hypothetical protein